MNATFHLCNIHILNFKNDTKRITEFKNEDSWNGNRIGLPDGLIGGF